LQKDLKTIWIGTALIGEIRIIAIAREEPPPQSFTISRMTFRSVSVKDLDSLYQQAKPLILNPEEHLE